MTPTPETHPAVISVECKELTIGYKAKRTGFREVAAGINAELCGGRLTSLIGSNGIGKSTLLRTLSAFQPPLAGDVLIQGKSLRRYTNKELSRLIGVVLTERPALQNMSVRELVGLGRSPYTGFWGKLTAADEEIVTEAIVNVGIENLQHRMIQTLSDGERQKVMIAKALAQQTPVIFLDEPTAFLDYQAKEQILNLLPTLARDTGAAILFTSHDLDAARKIATSEYRL